MEENLKLKYNELLESFKKGQQYLEQKPDDEKAQTRLTEIGKEMENVLQAIGNFTEEETTNGFKLDIPGDVSKEKKSNNVALKKENTQIQDFNNNWKLAEKLATSSLLPDEFKGHPENVLIALSMAQKMDLDPFTVCQNLHLVKRSPFLEWFIL